MADSVSVHSAVFRTQERKQGWAFFNFNQSPFFKKFEVKNKMTEEPEAFRDSRFTAEISNRMRVPDRIMVAGVDAQTRSPAFTGVNGPTAVASFSRDRDQMNDKFEMQVPERILVAGRDQHINAAKKSTPFEMQVENAVLPPTRLEVRVKNNHLHKNNVPDIMKIS